MLAKVITWGLEEKGGTKQASENQEVPIEEDWGKFGWRKRSAGREDRGRNLRGENDMEMDECEDPKGATHCMIIASE